MTDINFYNLCYSLGELAALVASEALTPAEGLRLAMARGRALHEAPHGAMLALYKNAHTKDTKPQH